MLGLGLLFLGSCGIAPQLTLKSRRYQKGLFVHLGWKQTKTHTTKISKTEQSLYSLPSIKTKSTISQWWTMQREGVALASNKPLHVNTQASEQHTDKNVHENNMVKETSFILPELTDASTKKIRKSKAVKKALRATPRGDEQLSLLSLIFGAGGFIILILGSIIPYIAILALLSFLAGLILGIIALSKEGSNAKAIIGLVLSSLGCLLWGLFAFLIGGLLLFAAAAA